MAIVVFDVEEFRQLYPKFTTVSDEELKNFFDIVGCIIYSGNTENSSIPYDPDKGIFERKTLMYMLVCHLAELSLRPNGLTGVLSSAAEGSVNASFTSPSMNFSNSWYLQTQCGFTYFQLIQRYILGGRYFGDKCKSHGWF